MKYAKICNRLPSMVIFEAVENYTKYIRRDSYIEKLSLLTLRLNVFCVFEHREPIYCTILYSI